MIFTTMEQRTDEWYAARWGKPTASQFGRLIGAKGALKKEGAATYEAELLGEKIFGRPMKRDISHLEPVRYGIEYEDEAAEVLLGRIDGEYAPGGGGFMTDDRERYGCSPDRRIIAGNRKELAEIKCPGIPQQIKTLLGGLGDEYYAQVQGQLLISGYECVHFYSYRHDCPPYYERVMPDRPYMAALAKLLDEFCDRLETNYRYLQGLQPWGEAP